MVKILRGLWGLTLLLAVAACSGPPPKTEPQGGETEASGETSEETTYDPAKDPLVNSPEMFEPMPEDRPEIVAEDETLIRILLGNPTTLNPIFQSSLYESHAIGPLYEGLVSWDAKFNWKLNDEVVESLEKSEDQLVWTMKIKPGIKWHDGRPWTAHDIRFSWQAILDDQVPCPAAKPGTDQIVDVRVIDDLTFEFVHKQPRPTNRWNISFPIIPKHIFGNPEKRAEDPSLKTSEYYNRYNRDEVVGSGPYRLVEWITNDRIVLERWDDYHASKPHFKRVIFKIQPDRNVALMLFKKGELDEMEITSQQMATQTNDEAFQKVGHKAFASRWSFAYIGLNQDGSNPFFNDLRVRRAMSHAIDIPRILDIVCYNLYSPCYGIFHPESWMFNPDIKLIGYDLTKASELLDEAGWKLSDDDGWRYKEIDGKAVKFEFELTIPQGSSYGPKVAAIFAQDLKKIGVSLKTRIMEWATFLEAIRKHEFQAEIARWGTGVDPDTNWNLWHSSMYDGGRNYVGFNQPRVDELLQLARVEMDQDQRAAYYQEMQKIIYDDQPYLFLWNDAMTYILHKRLKGITFSPRGVFGFDPSWSDWWVHVDERMH